MEVEFFEHNLNLPVKGLLSVEQSSIYTYRIYTLNMMPEVRPIRDYIGKYKRSSNSNMIWWRHGAPLCYWEQKKFMKRCTVVKRVMPMYVFVCCIPIWSMDDHWQRQQNRQRKHDAERIKLELQSNY